MFAEKLQEVMKERNLSQTEVAQLIGVTRPSVGYWLKGSIPTGENFKKLCKFLNINHLSQSDTSPEENDDTTVIIKALDREPTPEANITDGNRGVVSIRFSKEWINSRSQTDPDSIKVFNMTGQSMVNTLNNGDILIVDTSIKEIKYLGVYVLEEEGRYAVRRIDYHPDQGSATIILDSEQFPDRKDIKPETLNVVGRVIFAYNQRINF